MKINNNTINIGLATFVLCSTAHASCGSAFCSINANWDEHSSVHHGWSGDLRYSYSHADTLRSGSHTITADTTANGEVENLGTYNRIITATLNYSYDDHWGGAMILPYINREHAHNLGPYSGTTPAGYESFHASALGDIQLIGRYRWSLDPMSHSGMGVKFGLKLNTGKKDYTIEQTGEKPSEATLQPGNGSTDLILGVFWHQAIPSSNWSWFTQATYQTSISSAASFRPGNKIKLDAGTRYVINSNLSALLQLNAQWNDTDTGTSAALTESLQPSSGGRSISLTPGLSYAMTGNTQIYGLIQLPLYQYVNGEQLTPDSSMSVGVNHRF